MKTTDNAQKTENKKISNSVSKIFAVVLSLGLISLTVSANGFWKQLLVNNTYGKMAILMVDQEKANNEILADASTLSNNHSTDATGASNYFFNETAKEQKLGIESWMTNETNLGANAFTDQVGYEKPLVIENWMIENQLFNNQPVATEKDPLLTVESWMTDESKW